jgi:hypothetical protein
MPAADRRFTLAVTAVFLLLITLPYLLAIPPAGDAHVFGGILINVFDGNSYLAKAYQGWQGDWRFRLPYTAEPGEGLYIHLVYILIGHIARWTGLAIPFLHNAARVICGLVMLAALRRFLAAHLPEPRHQRAAFALAALGLGMGWAGFLFGAVTADFWVAEAYPLLAAFTNPHFPLGLALILWLATPRPWSGREAARLAGGAFLLGLVSPFGVATAALPWTGAALFDQPARAGHIRRAAVIILGGAPVLLYDYLTILNDPVLAGWNAQNLTVSPPWWDLLLSLSPALPLALAGMRRAPRPLAAWAALGLALIFIPFGLQRRFMLGLHLPLAALAALGLDRLRRWRAPLRGLLILLVMPTPLLILALAWFGVTTRSPQLYLSRGEAEAFAWLAAHAPPESLIIAAPETGMFLPAYTGLRVIYGHPFETVNAEAEKAALENLFATGDAAAWQAFAAARGAEYIFSGPRERALRAELPLAGLALEFDSGGVQIYRVP